MSHEIRTPISAVLGMNEMVLRESKDTEIKKYSMDIKSSAQALLGIINDILDFPRSSPVNWRSYRRSMN